MKKIALFLVSITLIIGGFFLLNQIPKITGQVTLDLENNTFISRYSYTKAICNESNHCQDYEITCEGREIKSLNPVTGSAIQHPDDWEDPRNEEEREILCWKD